jgi:hypothetical protein
MKRRLFELVILGLGYLGCSRHPQHDSSRRASAPATSSPVPAPNADTSQDADSASAPVASIRTHRASGHISTRVIFAELWKTPSATFRIHRLGSEVLATRGPDAFHLVDGHLEPEPVTVPGTTVLEFSWLSGAWRGYVYGIAKLVTMTAFDPPYDSFIRGFKNKFESDFDGFPAIWSKGRILKLNGGVFETNKATVDEGLPKVALGSSVECATRFVPMAFGAATDGRVLAVGPSCEQRGMLAIETWDDHGGEGKFQLLEGSNVLPRQDDCVTPPCSEKPLETPAKMRVLLGDKSGAIIVASTDRLTVIWRSEADAWRLLDTTEKIEIWSVTMDHNGALWAKTTRGEPTIMRLQGDTWTPVRLAPVDEVRSHLESPGPDQALSLDASSYITSKSGGMIGADIVDGTNRPMGGAILEIGTGPERSDTPALR